MINIFDLFKESQSQQIYIRGKAVDDLIATVHSMYGLGSPTVYDDMGFNKNDYVNPIFQNIAGMVSGDQISVQNAVSAIYSLGKYRNRQIPYYNSLKENIQILINQTTNAGADASIPDNKVVAMGSNQWGLIFKIKNLTKQRTINKAVKDELSNQGKNPDESWKHFRADSSKGLDIYQISPSVVSVVATILQNEGYDVSEMTQPSQSSVPSSLKRFDATLLSGGGVEVGFDYDVNLVEFIKRAKRRVFNGKEKRTWTIHDDKKFFDELEKYLDINGYDTSKLKSAMSNQSTIKTEPPQEKKGEVLYYDIYDKTNGKFHIAIVPLGGGLSKDIAEFLRFSFPNWVGSGLYAQSQDPNDPELKDAAIRTINKYPDYVQTTVRGSRPWAYEIKGLFSDYFSIEGIISKFGYDTKELRNIVLNLYKRGIIKKDAIPGVLDGFRKKDPTGERSFVNDDEAFYKTLDDNYRIKKKNGTTSELWPLQKEGVAFLYSRKSAILGDETGGGKTPISVVAADMRLAISGGKCLVITLPAAMLQWENTIKSIKGDQESISYDVLDGAKWTILSYNNLTNAAKADPNNPGIRKRDILIENIKKVGGFTALIIDECHMVKNNSIQTKNIMDVAANIPYVWGLSATIIANKPIDAYRQLKVIKHRLGQLPLKTFKEHFGGFIKTKGKGGRGKLDKGDESQVLKAASQLRKWLTLSGVYIKRSKKDINPNLPNHIIQDNEVNVDVKSLFADVAKRMETYTNPALVVSQMQAQRTELAKIKVPYTLDLAKSVLLQGKKVIVFTCFKDSAEMLMNGLQKIVNDETEEGGIVLGYLGGVPQSTRDSYKSLMQDLKSPAKAMVISILAGGTGLDLPNVVDDVIINDFSWTPKDAEQSEGRAFRITSENDVTTTYVVAANSPDQEFYDYVQIKKELANMIGNLTSMESQLIMQGKKPADIQKQIEDLQKKDQGLDTGILDYVKKFMGSLTGVGSRLSNNKFNMKKYKNS